MSTYTNPIYGNSSEPYYNSDPHVKRHLTLGEIIVTIALSVFAFLSANTFDRTNPPLATLLRFAAGTLTIFAIFHRCFSSHRRQPRFHTNNQPVNISVLPSAPPTFQVRSNPPLYPPLPNWNQGSDLERKQHPGNDRILFTAGNQPVTNSHW